MLIDEMIDKDEEEIEKYIDKKLNNIEKKIMEYRLLSIKKIVREGVDVEVRLEEVLRECCESEGIFIKEKIRVEHDLNELDDKANGNFMIINVIYNCDRINYFYKNNFSEDSLNYYDSHRGAIVAYLLSILYLIVNKINFDDYIKNRLIPYLVKGLKVDFYRYINKMKQLKEGSDV